MYLLLGGSGMLGSSVIEELSKYGSPKIYMPSHSELNITDEDAVFKYIKKTSPKVVINCAAAKNVDWCEQNAHEAFTLNATAVNNLARACAANKSKLHHISTEYVFDGLKDGFYTETDETNPINVYGASKLFSEKHVLKNGGYVYRVQWLYGPSKVNFISWLCSIILNNKKASITSAQVGSPSSTLWCSQVLLLAIAKNIPSGLYHLSHDDFCSRSEVARFVCDFFGRKFEDHFNVISDTNFGIAKRPMNSRICNKKLKDILKVSVLGSWKDDLNLYLNKHHKNH